MHTSLLVARTNRRRWRGVLLVVSLLVCFAVPVRAAAPQDSPPQAASNAPKQQTAPPNPGAINHPPPEPQQLSPAQMADHSMMTDREQTLSGWILVFGAAVLIVQYLLLRSPKRNSYEILQLLAINLIVTGTLFLISAGFSAQQISPGLGLFGTIAGYVLGRRAGDTPANDTSTDHNRGAS
jgi:hypothetical protein